MRQNIKMKFTKGELEGSYCSSYKQFSLCNGYTFENNIINALTISSNKVTVADFEKVFNRSITIDKPDSKVENYFPPSFTIRDNEFYYYGQLTGTSKSSIVENLYVSPIK